MTKKTNSTIDARNRFFMDDCMSIIKNYEYRNCRLNLRDAVRLTMRQTRPPRYAVNLEQACVMMRKFDRSQRLGRDICITAHRASSNNAQWLEIFDRVKGYRESHPSCLIENAVAHVIAHCKPSRHFITYDRAMRLMRPLVESRQVITIKDR
jgi:hypothetical protein